MSKFKLADARRPKQARPDRRARGGRPRILDDAAVERIVGAHDLGDSWNEIAQRHQLPRSTVRSIVERYELEQQTGCTKTTPEGCAKTASTDFAQPQHLSRSDIATDGAVTERLTCKPATREDEFHELVAADLGLLERSPSSLLQSRENCFALPQGQELREAVADALRAHVAKDVERGDTHVIWWSPTVPPAQLYDWPARAELLRQGCAPWVALKGWAPLRSLKYVLDICGAVAGVAAIDFRAAGPHFHLPVVVPREVTPKMIDDLWADEMGSRQPGPYWNHCKFLTHWEPMLRAQAGLRDDFDWQLGAVLRGVGNLVNYTFKGSDSGDEELVHAIMPRTVQERQASDFIVWARGVSFDGVDLGRFIEARLCSAPDVELRAAESHCVRCGELVSVVRTKDRERDPNLPPPKLRKVRSDRAFCSDGCRQADSRAGRRVLVNISRAWRAGLITLQPAHPCIRLGLLFEIIGRAKQRRIA